LGGEEETGGRLFVGEPTKCSLMLRKPDETELKLGEPFSTGRTQQQAHIREKTGNSRRTAS